MQVIFFIRTTTKKKTDSAKIRIRVKDGIKNLYAVTPLELPVKYWNQAAPKLRDKIRDRTEFLERDTYKDLIENLDKHIRSEYLCLKWEPDSQWLQGESDKYFRPEQKPEPEPEQKTGTLFKFIDEYVQTSKTRINHGSGKFISESTIKKYGTCYNLLKSFSGERSLNFEDIDQQFYDNFVRYLTTVKKHTTNTVGKQIAILKGFMNEAAERKLHTNTAHKSRKFKILSENVDSIYLNETELNTLFEYDFRTDPDLKDVTVRKLERVRDLFLIGAWTGCRFGDFTTIRPENIKDGFIYVEQEKTGNRVKIPLHPVVSAILTRYDGKLPRAISNQKFNDYIKDVAKAAGLATPETISYTKAGARVTETKPKHELISSHTARRSFATNLYKSKFPTIGIMKLTGHTTEKSFLKYIKVTPDEHAEMLQKHWLEYEQQKVNI